MLFSQSRGACHHLGSRGKRRVPLAGDNCAAIRNFTTCPQCEGKTRTRKLPLVIHFNPNIPMILEKISRYCETCHLLIVHRDQLEEQLFRKLLMTHPEAIDNDYLVVGTLNNVKKE